jgi:putative flippase GtrA
MNNLRKFIKYGTVAFGSALADWGVFSTLVLFNLIDPLFGQMISRIVGGIFSFATNKYWSFKSREGRHLLKEGRRFLLLYSFSYFLSISLFYALTTMTLISVFATKLVTDSAILVINFIVMNHYVFNRAPEVGLGRFIMRRQK